MSIIDSVAQPEKTQSLREQQRAFTRQRLIEAARQVFVERGYPDATVDEIASAAGASRATFYLHFKGKTELAAALIEESTPWAVERYRMLDDLLFAGGAGVRASLRQWLSEWLGIWSEAARESHALLQGAMLEPELEALRLEQSQALVSALEQYFKSLPATDRAAARERVLVLEIMTQRIFSLASMGRMPVDDGDTLDVLTDMWMNILVGR